MEKTKLYLIDIVHREGIGAASGASEISPLLAVDFFLYILNNH